MSVSLGQDQCKIYNTLNIPEEFLYLIHIRRRVSVGLGQNDCNIYNTLNARGVSLFYSLSIYMKV